jgi:O-antigen/teichoic acid export membrane protein
MSEVAMFSRGGGLVELFNRLVLRAIVPVCQPFFAKAHRDDGSVARGYLLSISHVTAVGWPALFFLALSSFPAVMILYGSQWIYSATLAKLLCAAAAAELVHYLSTEALLAVGEARRANSLQMLMQGARVIGILAVLPFGLIGACWGLIAASVVGVIAAQHAMYRAIGLRWSELLSSCSKSALVTLGTALPLWLWYLYQPPDEHNFVRWMSFATVLAISSWAGSLRLAAHPLWLELVSLAGIVIARFFKRA